jgi:hypothetical protein
MRYRDANQWEAPNTHRKWDYGARTDGQPEYRGHNTLTASDDDVTWLITFNTYSEAGDVIDSKTTRGSWTNRATLFA